MTLEMEKQLEEVISLSKIGRYDIVKLALEWIAVSKRKEEFKKLNQADTINKVLADVVTNVITFEKIGEARKKVDKQE
ncbi:MAG: hypothetical protein LBL77_00620 [Endomicrobium sp.]|jgi:hypothetical protein|nr:hypothetical protein [Endomicrobium sp.]